MKITFMTGAIAGAALMTAGGAAAGYHVYQANHTAAVVSVKPLMRTVKIPRQECHDEEVTHTKPVKDEHRLIGTGIGALVGGVIGHQVGGGTGKTLATVAGAGAGGYAGNKIQEKVQENDTYTSMEQRCATQYDSKQQPAGYEVVYTYKGEEHRVRAEVDPGSTLPVKDGKVELASLRRPPAG